MIINTYQQFQISLLTSLSLREFVIQPAKQILTYITFSSISIIPVTALL